MSTVYPPPPSVWQPATSRIVITQNANRDLRFPLSPTSALIQSLSFFADPSNTDPIALGNQEVILPAAGIPGQAYAVLGAGQMGRCYVENEEEFFDLSKFWVTQNHPTNTNLFYFTIWKRTR